MFGDECLYDTKNPAHVALARIESRHSGLTTVVAVGSDWYLVRHSKFSPEVRVHYFTVGGCVVHARGDSEHYETRDSFSETVPAILEVRDHA